MITERDIAEKFSVIWKQHFPLLTPNFMRVFNEAQIETINKLSIPLNEAVRYDLVSEAAFNLSNITNDRHVSPEEYLSDQINLLGLIKQTATEIWKSGKFVDSDLILNQFEIEEITKICFNITEFIQIMKKESVQFKPKLKGYSFIPDLIADLLIDGR